MNCEFCEKNPATHSFPSQEGWHLVCQRCYDEPPPGRAPCPVADVPWPADAKKWFKIAREKQAENARLHETLVAEATRADKAEAACAAMRDLLMRTRPHVMGIEVSSRLIRSEINNVLDESPSVLGRITAGAALLARHAEEVEQLTAGLVVLKQQRNDAEAERDALHLALSTAGRAT